MIRATASPGAWIKPFASPSGPSGPSRDGVLRADSGVRISSSRGSETQLEPAFDTVLIRRPGPCEQLVIEPARGRSRHQIAVIDIRIWGPASC